jgi:hypothetical protein
VDAIPTIFPDDDERFDSSGKTLDRGIHKVCVSWEVGSTWKTHNFWWWLHHRRISRRMLATMDASPLHSLDDEIEGASSSEGLDV